jgi:hypothetical protein
MIARGDCKRIATGLQNPSIQGSPHQGGISSIYSKRFEKCLKKVWERLGKRFEKGDGEKLWVS